MASSVEVEPHWRTGDSDGTGVRSCLQLKDSPARVACMLILASSTMAQVDNLVYGPEHVASHVPLVVSDKPRRHCHDVR